MPVDFCCHLVGKTPRNVCHCDSAFTRFIAKSVIIWTFSKTNFSISFEQHDKSSPFNSAHYIVLYPQNGDRIVTTDSVTSLHPMYTKTEDTPLDSLSITAFTSAQQR